MAFEYHPGPLIQGDVIVIEIGGKIVPKRPWDPSPQWFIARSHQKGSESVPLLPIDDTRALRPRIYKATWGRMMERRGFLKLFALAVASAALPSVALPQLGIAKDVPDGARYLANLRTVTAFDINWAFYITRMDILGKDKSGHKVQLGVDFRHVSPEPSEAELEPALAVLTDAAKADGIDLHALMPLEAVGDGLKVRVR